MDALTDPRWPDTFKADPQNPLFLTEKYPFSVRLGSQLDCSDGLIGYFLNGNYERFNAVHLPEGTQATYIAPIGNGNFIPLTFAPADLAVVTLLLDPRASVHAYSGLFPVQRLDLPVHFTRDALKNVQIAFHTNALLSYRQSTTDAQTSTTSINIQAPLPAEQGGSWSWLQLQHNAWQEYGFAPEDQIARLRDDLPALRDGLFVFHNALADVPAQEKDQR